MITNLEVTKTLNEIADILELKNESLFRINAYRQAARSIEFLEKPIEEIAQQKQLTEIEGVGESIAEKIEELIKVGKLKYLQDLKKSIPPGELELVTIPGVGPKTAQKIFELLKVKSIKELKKKLDTPSAASYFKEKTRVKIKKGIDLLSKREGRLLLSLAQPIAKTIINYLKEKCPDIESIDPVGSLRRWKETVGDLDIIATSKNPQKVIDAFIHYPLINQVINQGTTKSTVVHQDGIQIDLEILPQKEYGSLLQHFTGSKEHNVHLRTWAEAHGFSVSEHGIKIIKGKKRKIILCPKEVDVYHTLGMDWIPPELREDQGEIKAALDHQLPKLINLKDIKGDLHCHTKASDGINTIEELVDAAQKLNYQYLAIADHTKGLGIAGGQDEKMIERQRQNIAKINQKYPRLTILSGVEVNITAQGTLDIDRKVLNHLDVVTASIHSAFHQDKATMTKRLIKAVEYPEVDIIGHPSGRKIEQRESYELDWDQIFRACIKNQVALEISAQPEKLDLKDTLCRRAQDFGVKLVINSDSHRLEHLNLMIFGVSVARRGWIKKEQIINTWPTNLLLKWLKKH